MENLISLLSINSAPAVSEPASKVPYDIMKVAKSKKFPGSFTHRFSGLFTHRFLSGTLYVKKKFSGGAQTALAQTQLAASCLISKSNQSPASGASGSPDWVPIESAEAQLLS